MLSDEKCIEKAKKRFIASAICPRCHAFDSIVWCVEPDEYIQCIRCDFIQKKAELVKPGEQVT